MSDVNTSVEAPVELTHLQQQMLRLMNQPKKKVQTAGLGFMWSKSTQAIGELSDTIAQAATATRLMASLGVTQAMQANMEADEELLASYGITATGYEAVEAAKLLKSLILGR